MVVGSGNVAVVVSWVTVDGLGLVPDELMSAISVSCVCDIDVGVTIDDGFDSVGHDRPTIGNGGKEVG